MNKISILIVLFTVFFKLNAISQNTVVTVGGDVEKPLRLDSATMQKMRHVSVKALAHADHKEHEYSGIPLSEIINESGAVPVNQLKGKYLAKYILVKAADGYKAVFALPEVDSAFTDQIIILADKVDGAALPPNAGPFQIIVPRDKKPARCVRQVTAINILTAKED